MNQDSAVRDRDRWLEQAEARIVQANVRTDLAEGREQTLRASELSYRRLFESARDGILILDVSTGRISDVNPFVVELLGFSHDEMLGKTVGELSPINDTLVLPLLSGLFRKIQLTAFRSLLD